MVVDIKSKYQEIKEDIFLNQKEIFLRYNYYSHKWRGDRINDINVGLFLDDNQRPVAQVFLRNKTGYIKSHIVFNKEGNKIIDIIKIYDKVTEKA